MKLKIPIVPTERCWVSFVYIIHTYQSLFRIFQVPKLGTKLKQDAIPLSYTPRKMTLHPTNGYLYIIEGDHRVLGEDAAKQKLDKLVS